MSDMSERLCYALLNLVGEVVVVHLCDGARFQGVLAGRSYDSGGLGVLLLQARRIVCDGRDFDSAADVAPVMPLSAGDVMFIEAEAAPFTTAAAVTGNVSHVSPKVAGELLKWSDVADNNGVSLDDMLDATSHREGSWNQFDANKKLGVTTSYREDMYTTQLDKSKMTKEQQARAAELERQINQRGSKGVQHDIERGRAFEGDEGAAFSDVARPQLAAVSAGEPSSALRVAAAPPPVAAPSNPRHWHMQPNSLARAFAAAISRRYLAALTAPIAWAHAPVAPCAEEDGGDYSEAQYAALKATAESQAQAVKVTVGAAPAAMLGGGLSAPLSAATSPATLPPNIPASIQPPPPQQLPSPNLEALHGQQHAMGHPPPHQQRHPQQHHGLGMMKADHQYQQSGRGGPMPTGGAGGPGLPGMSHAPRGRGGGGKQQHGGRPDDGSAYEQQQQQPSRFGGPGDGDRGPNNGSGNTGGSNMGMMGHQPPFAGGAPPPMHHGGAPPGGGGAFMSPPPGGPHHHYGGQAGGGGAGRGGGLTPPPPGGASAAGAGTGGFVPPSAGFAGFPGLPGFNPMQPPGGVHGGAAGMHPDAAGLAAQAPMLGRGAGAMGGGYGPAGMGGGRGGGGRGNGAYGGNFGGGGGTGASYGGGGGAAEPGSYGGHPVYQQQQPSQQQGQGPQQQGQPYFQQGQGSSGPGTRRGGGAGGGPHLPYNGGDRYNNVSGSNQGYYGQQHGGGGTPAPGGFGGPSVGGGVPYGADHRGGGVPTSGSSGPSGHQSPAPAAPPPEDAMRQQQQQQQQAGAQRMRRGGAGRR